MRELAGKFAVSIQREGFKETIKKSKRYVLDYVVHGKQKIMHSYVDVLFINGCMLPHPMRYRVLHQSEQLLMANVTSSTVYFEKLELEMVNHARVFVFFRCPHTDTIEEFIRIAKSYNKIVIFDIDDLVFDTTYTDSIKFVQNMPESGKRLYDDGVLRMGKTLKLCDIATTTTEALASELAKYVRRVYINRNVASDGMLLHSEEAIKKLTEVGNNINEKKLIKVKGQISLGYFSGSITHNDDFAIILPTVTRILKQNDNVHLYLVGELELPNCLNEYRERIHTIGFMDWEKLPFAISQMDINLAPLEDTLFNCAKSENKWTEAALVKVITVASDVGAFGKMIENGVTGVLCSNTNDDWYNKLDNIISNENTRKRIANNAYQFVKKYCLTIETCWDYADFIKNVMSPNLMYKIPTAQISGGTLVAERHAAVLQDKGIDVSFINDGGEEISKLVYGKNEFPVIRSRSTALLGSIDTAIATLYTTMEFVQNYPNIKKRLYLVQGLETNFSSPGTWGRIKASQSYTPVSNVGFITVSRWCQRWLQDKYHVAAKYAPNGIDCQSFRPHSRDFSGKIRILIEGNSDDYNKNVDESFRIVQELDAEKFEIWYISYQGKPKDWYRVDEFFRKIPNTEMPKLYESCHILLKSSIFESFSYPPLEMMATGGLVVVRSNEGNAEYLRDGENCLFYNPENLSTAKESIKKLVVQAELRKKLIDNGIQTAADRDWDKVEMEILELYKS